jgi:UDP-sugar transporter A1/2/3
LLVAAVPAALYAVQGVLTYTSLQRLDAVTFNGLSQLKMVSAAIWCFILLGTTQSMQQMAAIAVLLISAVIFQHQPNTTTTTSISTTTTTTTITTTTGQENDEKMKKNKSVSVTGVVTCLAATFVSGLAGALSQRGVQFVGRQHSLPRDPFLFAGEVSFYSALCLVGSLFQQRQQRPWSTKQQQQHPHDSKLFQHIRPWIPVTVKAMGGIVTVLVHKYAGSVLKGFALVLGLVLSGVYEYDHLTAHQIVGTVLVLLSSWMHFTSP